MTYKIIAFIIMSCLAGIKKPIYGGLTGMIAAPVMSIICTPFDLPTVVVLAPFGFGFGLILGLLAWNIFHGLQHNRQNEKTYYMPMSRNMRRGIIHTDEEEKNAKDNLLTANSQLKRKIGRVLTI
jgi:hypothetical protein